MNQPLLANSKQFVDTPYLYKFTFSSAQDLSGKPSICRIVTITLLIVCILFVPAVKIADTFLSVNHNFSLYVWFVYLLVFNSVMLLWVPEALASTMTYPYSNSFILNANLRDMNNKIGTEFRRCIERMTRLIQDSMQSKSHEFVGGQGADDLEDNEALSPKDIYMRIASNLEMI